MRDIELFKDYENARLLNVGEFQKAHRETTVSYDDLETTDVCGIPVAVTRNGSGKLDITFVPDTHVLAIGATRSGKTTGFVIPTLNILAKRKNKPSIVISDPKQELYKDHIAFFKEMGYDVILLNFNDYMHSDCWNPLTKYYRLYQKYLCVEQEVGLVETDHGPRNIFRGVIYEDQEKLDAQIEREKNAYLAETEKGIFTMVHLVVSNTSSKDPFWDDSARDLLSAILYGMLEDIETGIISEKTFSFDTVLKICDSFSASRSNYDNGYFSRRPSTSKALQLAKKCILEQAESTRKCIASSFAVQINKFRDTSIRFITKANTFDITQLNEGKPKAIFLSYKDEESLHYEVISMFLTTLYTELITAARQKGEPLDRPFYFLLDEFGNLPPFKDFDKVISACGGRNIWFLLVLQSYAQLNNIYGKEVAEIIKDNLNMHLFFGTNNPETKVAFSGECGKKTVISPLSALGGEGPSIVHYAMDTVPLVPVSALNELKAGECIVTQMREDVVRSYIERSYLCKEYIHTKPEDKGVFETKIDLLDSDFCYDPLKEAPLQNTKYEYVV